MRNRAICANVGVMKDTIYITSQDKQRLEELLAEAAVFDARKQGDLKALEEELRRAVIVDPKEAPADVITMNSRAELIDLDTGETVAEGDGGGSKSVIAGYETQLDERRRLKVAFDFGDCINEAVELGGVALRAVQIVSENSWLTAYPLAWLQGKDTSQHYRAH